MDFDKVAEAFREFVTVVKALRTPGTGCPWDLEQNHRTLRPYLVEETYEVIDAIDHGEDAALQEELGDLLLQVVLHAQLAADRRAFTIVEVIQGIHDKMVRRHPHVFGDAQVSGSDEVLRNWEQIKADEKSTNAASAAETLDRVPQSLPALLRAQRLGGKAAKMGHDSEDNALDLVRLHMTELETGNRAEARDEAENEDRRALLEKALGDALFSLCQVARRFGLDAEESLRASNRRFVDRFKAEREPLT